MCVCVLLFVGVCVFNERELCLCSCVNGLVITIGLDFDLLYLIFFSLAELFSPHNNYLNL